MDADEEENQSKDTNGRQKFQIQVSQMTNKPSKMLEVQEKVEFEYDYSLLDQLLEFLDTHEELLPILCGYFNKIMQALLNKQKAMFLEYLLLERNGSIFNLLMKQLQHHSLASLLVELLQMKVTNSHVSRQRVASLWN